MPIQLAGNIRHGGLYETAFGITLRELVCDIGGGTASGRAVKVVKAGGPSGASIHHDQFALPLDYEAYAGADALSEDGSAGELDATGEMGEKKGLDRRTEGGGGRNEGDSE